MPISSNKYVLLNIKSNSMKDVMVMMQSLKIPEKWDVHITIGVKEPVKD